MLIEINNEDMALTINSKVIATTRFPKHATTHGNCARIVSAHPSRRFNRNEAITAMVLVVRLAAGIGDADPVRRVLGAVRPVGVAGLCSRSLRSEGGAGVRAGA
jgi:hypothetical protein